MAKRYANEMTCSFYYPGGVRASCSFREEDSTRDEGKMTWANVMLMREGPGGRLQSVMPSDISKELRPFDVRFSSDEEGNMEMADCMSLVHSLSIILGNVEYVKGFCFYS